MRSGLYVAVVALVATACGGAAQQPSPATATDRTPLPTIQAAQPTAIPQAALTSTPGQGLPATPGQPTPNAATTRPPTTTGPPPALTPRPAVALRITAALEPPTPRAGADFVLQLTVANDGDRPAHGVYVATSGPWERWTVLEVLPPGTFGRDAAGWHILSPVDIPPQESRLVEVRVQADAASEEQLTFAVREAEPGELR